MGTPDKQAELARIDAAIAKAKALDPTKAEAQGYNYDEIAAAAERLASRRESLLAEIQADTSPTPKPKGQEPPAAANAPGEFLTAAQHAGQGFLAGYGDEIMGPIGEMAGQAYVGAGRALGVLPPEDKSGIGKQYAPGQEPVLDPGEAIRRELAAGKKENPIAATGGDIAGSGLRYAAAAMTPVGKALEKAPALAKFGAGLAAGVAEPALRQSGEAASGERLAAAGKGALSAVDSPTAAALTVGGAALGPVAGKIGMAKPALANERALEARLLAAGFNPNMIKVMKHDMGDKFYDWAQKFEDAGFHQGAKFPLTDTNLPTSLRAASEKARMSRVAGEQGLESVSQEATRMGITTDNQALIAQMEERARGLLNSTVQSQVDEGERWQAAADLIKKQRGREATETPRVMAYGRVKPKADVANPDALPPLAPGARVRSPSSGQKPYISEVEDLAHPGIMKPDPQRKETLRIPTDWRVDREKFAAALKQKQAEGQAGHDMLRARKGPEAREARIREGLRREQLTEALPENLRADFERANQSYNLGKAGEDAANSGVVSVEFQDPRQALRDMDRLAINLDVTEKGGGPIAQLIRDQLVAQYGRDWRARWLRDTAERAEANRFGRGANMLRNLAPGANAEMIAREIERQKLERQGAAGD